MYIRRDTFNFNRDTNIRIVLNCCAFDRLLDASIDRGVYGGFQFDVSYLTSDDMSRDKQFIFLIKSDEDEITEESFNGVEILPTFLKVESVRLSNVIESFYIFYYELKPNRELRDQKIIELTEITK